MRRPSRKTLFLVSTTFAILATLFGDWGDWRQTLEAANERSFTNFETEPVRPIVLLSDGAYLYVLNTADDRLEVWENSEANVRRVGEVRVGLRPVALAVGDAGDVWVSNHLGDSVSVIDASNPVAPVLVIPFRSATSRGIS